MSGTHSLGCYLGCESWEKITVVELLKNSLQHVLITFAFAVCYLTAYIRFLLLHLK